jgi:hypothetical protein
MVTLTYAFPQVHSKYYYNISSGVVLNTVHGRTFGWQPLQPGSYYPIQTGSSVKVDPVLLFSAYLWPMDAESTWQPKDLRPALTFGFSLASPAGNFYMGGSSEIRRNIQIVYGFTVSATTKLAYGVGVSTLNTAAPATSSTFGKGAFIGLSYNISGFLQSLFSPSKGGS